MKVDVQIPPGAPGIMPRWTSSHKTGVGTALSGNSDVWFTISHGIINEIYYPRVDIANIRDMGLIVTDGKDFFSEEKRETHQEVSLIADGVPAYRLINTHSRYRIEKTVITDPERCVFLQEIQFTPLIGSFEDYHLYVLLAPHINNAGYGNTGWAGDFKGCPMLFAERAGVMLALGCSTPFINMSCGYVGISDGWQDLSKNKKLTNLYPRAENGNIALVGEIDLLASRGKVVLALSFGHQESGLLARASLTRDFNWILKNYIDKWEQAQRQFIDLSTVDKYAGKLFRMSTAVLRTHEGKHYSGCVIASLSIPWGFRRCDHELGGYHLIWPRDQVETALALLAAGDTDASGQILLFLIATQEDDGHWEQCMWADGTSYWKGLQLDETALPILLADLLKRNGCIKAQSHPTWEMVKKAATFLIQHGPVTEQDRWEENPGYTPFTLAAQIAALLAAADFFEEYEDAETANYLREAADWWNENIERWLYVTGTDLALHHGVDGYYVRISPAEPFEDCHSKNKQIIIKNRPEGQNIALHTEIVSVDALAFVRFGLRSASDPRILNTVKVIDALLKTETSKGPIWHRYNEDGYGEHADGSPYDGIGIGRGWPLLVGERAHYELAKGNKTEALALCRLMTDYAGVSGLIPEQIWDAPDIPEAGLYNGHASGSAKPLVWAHSEYITLLRSLKDGKVFNMPPQTVKRYLNDKMKACFAHWRPNYKCVQVPSGKKLRIQCCQPAKVHWTSDDWKTSHDTDLMKNKLGLYYADLPVQSLKKGDKVIFTLFWTETQHWEGQNYELPIV